MREEFINFVKKELPKILLIQAKKDGIPIKEENIKLINDNDYLHEHFDKSKFSNNSSFIEEIKKYLEVLIIEMNYLSVGGYTRKDKIRICFQELNYYFDNINLIDSVEESNYFYKLISILYHEYSHLKDNYFCKNFEINFLNEHPEFIFESLLITEDNYFYKFNHDRFDLEQRANICSMELMDENYQKFDSYKKYDYVSTLIKYINYNFDYIMYESDNIMKKNFKRIQEDSPNFLLLCLYEDGRTKNIDELLIDKEFNELYEEFPSIAKLVICNRLKDKVNNDINMKNPIIVDALEYKKERYENRNKKINDLINKFLDKYEKNKTK